MDPFTQKLLEKTRQRREQLQQKLQSTPSATRKRKPLEVDTSQNSVPSERPLLSEKQEEKRRKSSTNAVEPVSSVSGSKVGHDSSTKSKVDSGIMDAENTRHILGAASSHENSSPKPATRKGRLQMLAAQINNWEDDLSHPQPIAASVKDLSNRGTRQSAAVSEATKSAPPSSNSNRPPKPPRAAQSESRTQEGESNRRSPRLSKQAGGDRAVNDAFSFGVPGSGSAGGGSNAPPTRVTPVRSSKPPASNAGQANVEPRASQRNHSDDEPTQKAVADRFSMWEKRTGDSLTPLRQGASLRGGAKATPTKQGTFANSAKKAFVNQPATAQSQTAEYKPEQLAPAPARARRRSRSAAPATPERERTGASAPWHKPASTVGSAVKFTPKDTVRAGPSAQASTPQHQQQKGSNDDEWGKAPMSARKFAWEAKIAEQQNVASEHNRVMYRTRSASRLGDTPCQKQEAENKLRKGQEKVYDPAERARMERQAELELLQNRFNNKGLLKSAEKAPQPGVPSKSSAGSSAAAPRQVVATSMESLENEEYFTASDSELNMEHTHSSSNNATAGSSADEMKPPNKRQVSFKSPTRPERRKSDTPPESDYEHERKVKRRSSCKIPTLGYDSSSEDEEVIIQNPKFFSSLQEGKGSPNKIPRLGDESSADSPDLEELDMRQTSGSSIGSSVSSYSYHFVSGADGTPQTNSRDVADFLDEAMTDDEPTPQPHKHKPSPHRKTPEHRRETRSSRRDISESPAALYSIDQYRQKTKSVATLNSNSTAMRKPISVFDTDDSTMSDETSSSQYSMSESDRRKKVKELQELVQQEQNVIVQASNALNQCCKTGSNFAGSTEQVECNRLLLIACQRRQAYMGEIARIKANPHTYERRKGKGSLTISNIELPLKRDFVKKIGSPEDDTVHYFLVMVRAGPQVIVSQMVSTHDSHMRGTLNFPNLTKLNDIMNDFRYELEVYGMQVSRPRDPIKQSGKKDKKSKTSSISRAREASQSGSSSSSVRTTNFTHITSLMLTMDCVKHSSFKLSRVPYLSPLHGTMHMTLRCTMETNIVFKGFINMFEDVGGFGAWHRRWSVLNSNKVSYWKYPDDEHVKEPIGQIDLKDCVTTEVTLVSRDKCARPNTIELIIVRPASRTETSGMNKQIRDRMVYEHHWFGMDTKSDRLDWCTKLNEALVNVRQWYSDAARPIPARRMEI